MNGSDDDEEDEWDEEDEYDDEDPEEVMWIHNDGEADDQYWQEGEPYAEAYGDENA